MTRTPRWWLRSRSILSTPTPHDDDTQFFGSVEQFGGDFGRAAHDQGIRIGELRVERVLGGLYDVPTALLLEQLHAAVADLVRYDYFHEPVVSSRFFPQSVSNPS